MAAVIMVTGVSGRSIYEPQTMYTQTLRFGDKLMNGLYQIEVKQGEEVKIIKTLKN